MAPHIQLLVVCLFPLVSASDDGQGRTAVWSPSAPPSSSSPRQARLQQPHLTKDGSDGSPDGLEERPVAGPTQHRQMPDPDSTTQGLPETPGHPVLYGHRARSLTSKSGRGKRSLNVSLKPGLSEAVGRAGRPAEKSPLVSRPSPAASRRADSGYIPPGFNALIRSSLGHSRPRRGPPGSFVARLPQRRGRGRPYLVRLPAGRGAIPRKRKRLVLIVPVKGHGPALRRPAVVPVVRDASGAHQPALVPVGDAGGGHLAPPLPVLTDTAGHQGPAVVPAGRDIAGHQPAGLQVIRDPKGGYHPPPVPPPPARHRVVNPQTVYTLDNPRLRQSGIKGYGPPKLQDVLSCTELDVSDCYL